MSSLVREPCWTSLLGGGVGVGVGFAVGRGVGRGVGFAVGRGVGRTVGRAVGFAVGRGVGRAVGLGDGVSVAAGVGVSQGDAVEAGERVGVGAWVGTDTLGDGAGDREPGAAGAQPATTRAAARAALTMEPCTTERRSITGSPCRYDTPTIRHRADAGYGRS
jgi:hypothetical protein